MALTRRQLVQAGGLSLLGLTSGQLTAMRAASAEPKNPRSQHRCIFIFLFGGPSHIDLWDMKPEAPAEIRGDFQPVATRTPGIRLCEHLPKMAAQMDKFCLLRSMTHHMPVHGPACSEMFTGREYFGPPKTDQATPQDWPSLSSLVMRYGQTHGLPPSIVLPWYIQFHGQSKRIAGQTGGRMGENHKAFLVEGDPSQKEFAVDGLKLPEGIDPRRIRARRDLLQQIEQSAPSDLTQGELARAVGGNYEKAFAMLGETDKTAAFDLASERKDVRERYGETKFGQSLLLARRLVEAGVSLVTVNWDDETKTDKVSPFWDTHHLNFPKLKDRLAPVFDHCYSALLEDLHQRGLLESTLVVVTGEFGRTPKIGRITQNGMTEKTGRDHWPHAFTVLLAGGGVRGGQVYGATNDTGGHVRENPVSPADLSATILHHLGVNPSLIWKDSFQSVPRKICEGRPIRNLG